MASEDITVTYSDKVTKNQTTGVLTVIVGYRTKAVGDDFEKIPVYVEYYPSTSSPNGIPFAIITDKEGADTVSVTPSDTNADLTRLYYPELRSAERFIAEAAAATGENIGAGAGTIVVEPIAVKASMSSTPTILNKNGTVLSSTRTLSPSGGATKVAGTYKVEDKSGNVKEYAVTKQKTGATTEKLVVSLDNGSKVTYTIDKASGVPPGQQIQKQNAEKAAKTADSGSFLGDKVSAFLSAIHLKKSATNADSTEATPATAVDTKADTTTPTTTATKSDDEQAMSDLVSGQSSSESLGDKFTRLMKGTYEAASDQIKISLGFKTQEEIDLENAAITIVEFDQETISTEMKESATDTDSPTNQGMTGRGDQKQANNRSIAETVKQDIYHLKSTDDLALVSENNTVKGNAADFYRHGKYENDISAATSKLKYLIPPRDFTPLDFKGKPSSIRIWGKVKARNEGSGKKKASTKMGDLIPAYTKFILESVQESRTERSQIIETFGDFYVFMFGERPPVFNFSGHLINSTYTNWANDFDFMYEKFLRGTKCVDSGATTLITYGGRQVEGLILNMGTQTSAAMEGVVPVQFSVVVFNRRSFNYSEDMGYSTSDNRNLAVDEKFKDLLGKIASPEGKGMSRPEVSAANKAAKDTLSGGKPCSGTKS